MIFRYQNIRFFIKGKGRKIIIFFHGFGQTPIFYKKILDELSKYYLVIAPFLSDFENFDDHLNTILDDFLNKLKIKKIILIAHSMGGSISLKFSLRNNDKVNKIILFNPFLIKEKLNLLEKFLNISFDSFYNKKILNNIFQLVYSYFIMIKNFLFHRKNFVYQIKYCLNLNIISEMKNIKKPTIILGSNKDKIVSLDSLKKANFLIKNSEIKIFKGNHTWFLQNPKKTVILIKNYI